MSESSSTRVKVGVLIAVALAVFAFAVVSVGTRQKLFTRSVTYTVHFRTVAGLQDGSPVKLHGVRIGTVKSVSLTPDPVEQRIDVVLSIERRYARHIRTDTMAQIKTIGLLGDKYVFLSSERDPEAEPIEPGGAIRVVELVDYDVLVRQSEDILTNAAIISSSLRQLLLGLERGETLVGKLFSDPDFGHDLVDSMTRTVKHWEGISSGVHEGRGLAGRFLTDEAYAERIASELETSISRLERILATTEEGKNLAGKLLVESPESEELFDNLVVFSKGLREVGEAFEKNEGFLPSLIEGSTEGREMASSFHATLHSLASILDKLDRGEGSASAFLNDPTLYQAMEDIVGAVSKSGPTKWFIRKKRRKGERQRLKQERMEAAATEESSSGGKERPSSDSPADSLSSPPGETSDEPDLPDETLSEEQEAGLPHGGEKRSALAPQGRTLPAPHDEVVVTAKRPRDPFAEPPPPPKNPS
jgi:phospholipid/cholesterol/gamma-HCH transport system substrate-binding protein